MQQKRSPGGHFAGIQFFHDNIDSAKWSYRLPSPAGATMATDRGSGRIAYVTGDARERLGRSAVLIRPDGFVAWAADAEPNLEEAAQAASRWFGEPEEAREPV
jgi:hypothetical protein